MKLFPTQSHYPNTEQSSHCPIWIMLSARLSSNMYQFGKSLWTRLGFKLLTFRTGSLRSYQFSKMKWWHSLFDSTFQTKVVIAMIGWLLGFYVLASSRVIYGWVMTCLYSGAPLGDQATSTKTWYRSQSYYPDIESFPILIMPNAWLGSDTYKSFKSLVWLG